MALIKKTMSFPSSSNAIGGQMLTHGRLFLYTVTGTPLSLTWAATLLSLAFASDNPIVFAFFMVAPLVSFIS